MNISEDTAGDILRALLDISSQLEELDGKIEQTNRILDQVRRNTAK